jgi:signal transduction histidine kinase
MTTARTTRTTTAGTTTETTERLAAAPPGPLSPGVVARIKGRAPWGSWNLRARLLAGFALLFLVAGALIVLAARQILLLPVDDRIDRELVREAEALRGFAHGIDPSTGRPFGTRVKRMFEIYLQHNVPEEHQAFFTFIDGEVTLRRGSDMREGLSSGAHLPPGLMKITEPSRGSAPTTAGVLEYLAVPVRAAGTTTGGVFVAAVSRDMAHSEIGPALTSTALTVLILVAVGSFLAWRLAGRILDPVRTMTEAALALSSSNPTGRLDVREEAGEIARLGSAFNGMLQQLENAFATQERFTGDAVQHLQGPIMAIRKHIGLLQADPEGQARRVPLVAEELDRLRTQLDDLSLLAHSTRPDFLHLSTVDLRDVMRSISSAMEGFEVRRWRIESVGPERIVADRDRLTQALLLVAQNAVAHTQEDDVITLGSVVLPEEARLCVRTTRRGGGSGRGERSPERFLRAEGETSYEIGLAIVKAIAQAHRGRVATSHSSTGDKTVTIVVPVDQPES